MNDERECKSFLPIADTFKGIQPFVNVPESVEAGFRIVECLKASRRFDLARDFLGNLSSLEICKGGDFATRINSATELLEVDTAVTKSPSRTEGSTNPPPLLIRGMNFASAIYRWTVAGMPRRSQAEIDERLAICQACPELVDNHCRKCGCACVEANQLINKLALATEVCPLGKWK